jgi:hypothetical protein
VSVAALDEDVLAQLREHVLTPERIERVVPRAIELHTASPGDTEAQQHALRAEVRGLDRELTEFTRAVAAGASDIPALVAAMRATQRRRDEAAARLEHLDGLDRAAADWDRRGLAGELQARLREWQHVLVGQPVQGRQILQRLLVGRLVVTSQEDARGRATAHAWAGEASYGRLLAGIVGVQAVGGPSEPACYDERQ